MMDEKGAVTEKRQCLRALALLIAPILFSECLSHGQQSGPIQTRPITVADAIGMTRLADTDYFAGGPGRGQVAHFSPDRKRFIVVLQKGNLSRNVNEFTMLLFDTTTLPHVAMPVSLVTMASSSNRDAIKDVKWLSDSRTVAFIGEQPGGFPQVYTVDIKRRRLRRITNHPTAISDYDIRSDGRELVFVADSPLETAGSEDSPRDGIVITHQSLFELLSGCSSDSPWKPATLFLQRFRGTPVEITMPPGKVLIRDSSELALSPDGRYALMTAWIEDVPSEWTRYEDRFVHQVVTSKPRRGQPSHLKEYLLLDTRSGEVSLLLNAPMLGPIPATWAPDSRSILLRGAWLPLETRGLGAPQPEHQTYDVEIVLPSKSLRVIRADHLPAGTQDAVPIAVQLKEDVNTPPRLYVSSLPIHRDTLLLDLNPQFSSLRFGIVNPIEWEATDGHTVLGGLYLPPDFQPGRRYPLVIQTHGFRPDQFSMDGRSEWSSGFAARPLAAKGIVVLQVGGAKNRDDFKYADAVSEGPREMSAYEGAIDHLDSLGLIDRDRIGIVGFSRTVFEVAYTLTHSKYRFAAACLVDGIDGGYFQEIAFGPGDGVFLNGAEPAGHGLEEWLKNSPGFNLDKVHAPIRLVALGPSGVLEVWEWFAVLSRLSRAVELMYLPQAAHLIVKPRERMAAQQALLDWFCFWLEGRSDNAGAKEQYQRWLLLRQGQSP